MSYTFYAPTRVLFGAGRLNDLHTQIMPGKKAMIVISNGKSTRANGALSRTEEQLRLAGIDTVVFDKVEANPLKSTVEAGVKFAKEAECDFIVALGGGSIMDAAKVMAMYTLQPGDLWDYVGGSTGKNQPLVNPTLPWIAITTTAGTGSEVDQWGVITNPETNEKIGCGGQDSLFPAIAVVDAELMLTVPPKFTAYQGFDALFHSTEGYISCVSSPMADMVQLAAIENVGKYLPRAVKDGNDLEAREHVAFANTMSGYSMVVGACTSEHSMEHAMSAYHQDLPHGAGLIMLSKEYYTHFVNKHVCDERFIRMAQALGKKDASDPMDFVAALTELQKVCGVADLKMSDYGIVPDEFDTLARNARETMGGLFACDATPMTHEECVEIFRKSCR
ncbi:iron-containing alcohol dehydrogenase [Clostridium sp. KNHs205]|uniref:iron-containing alcohol dehydrogenase n=1 Tax=Clostridium sp. KNHs205 TaxID=1449050 RepID=UPI00051C5A72|nr:iron-containing alcohol dehydrogenase [Clostridium sp. KNHs205]